MTLSYVLDRLRNILYFTVKSCPGTYTALQAPMNIVSCPAPPRTCEKRGSGVLNDFSCHSSPIRELESDCRTSSSTRSSMPAVRCTCTGNAIFTPFDPAPCDKKCRSEHQTLFLLFGKGSGDETTMNTTFMDKSRVLHVHPPEVRFSKIHCLQNYIS